jgi:hypothetical protein
LGNTKVILDCLPETNWFKMTEKKFFPDPAKRGDNEVVDIFLHSQDRAYTVGEIYQWLGDCGLKLVDFAEGQIHYRPEFYIKDPAVLGRVKQLPVPKQQAITELLVGSIRKHVFYASANINTVADPRDFDNVPCFHELAPAKEFYHMAENKPQGSAITLGLFDGSSVNFVLGSFAKYFFQYIDGMRTIGECIEMIRAESEFSANRPSREAIVSEYMSMYELLNMTGLLTLRHKSVKPFKTFEKLHIPVNLRHDGDDL